MRNPVRLALSAALVITGALAAIAGAKAAPTSPDKPAVVPGGSVVYGQGGGWRMVVAPTSSPREALTLYTSGPADHGRISLVCQRHGGLSGDIAIIPEAALGLPIGAAASVDLSVDGETHAIEMTAVKGGLVSSGAGVLAMMSRLGELSPGVGDTVSATYLGRQILSAPVPADHAVISNASGICLDWLHQERTPPAAG